MFGLFQAMAGSKTQLVSPAAALPGRSTPIPTAERHAVLGTALKAPLSTSQQEALFGCGCFWGAEKGFWRLPGVVTTAVGYAGGFTPNPAYEEVCSGATGHTEVVRVVWDVNAVDFSPDGRWLAAGSGLAALGLAGAFGLTELLSFDRMISIIGKMAWQQSTSFILVALPLFILMGEVMLQAGMMQRIYDSASKLVAALPGGLLQTNIAASMVFAACTGSSLASAATIGSSRPSRIRRARHATANWPSSASIR